LTFTTYRRINLSQDKNWQWLGKGLSDMLITDLSVYPEFQLIDREDLHEYIEELALPVSGLFDENTLLKIGQFAKVEKIIFGTYLYD
jgi:curli biogenesis system outer membrane secretion channel CsgG